MPVDPIGTETMLPDRFKQFRNEAFLETGWSRLSESN